MRHSIHLTEETCHHQAGFTLIEILVSLVILTIGLLGTAGLQVASLRSNQLAGQSSQAVAIARDFQGLMQSLRPTTSTVAKLLPEDGCGSGIDCFDTSIYASPSDIPNKNCKAVSATCTLESDLIDFHYRELAHRIKTELPNGRAVLCYDSAPKDSSGSFVGLYHWDCTGTGGATATGALLLLKIGWELRNSKGEQILQSDRPKLIVQMPGLNQELAAP